MTKIQDSMDTHSFFWLEEARRRHTVVFFFVKQAIPLSDRGKRILRRTWTANIFAFEQGLVEYSGRKLFDRELDDK